jgi:CYTH domain-containing protein
MWQAILDENAWSLVGLRDKRYDAVIHLTSAAVGAKEAYTLENNAARSETPEQAADIDLKTRNAWIGHHHLRSIDNYPNFSDKINAVLSTISTVLGIPEPIENERKFLVKSFDIPENFGHEKIDIEQTYLLSSDKNEVARVRKRGQHGVFSYTHTSKRFLSGGKNIERERMISSREYLNLITLADPEKEAIKKTRICFLYENQYFELDVFQDKELIMLEAELEDYKTTVALPPWINIEREVTEEKEYSNAYIARKNV